MSPRKIASQTQIKRYDNSDTKHHGEIPTKSYSKRALNTSGV